jgi:hypothetical protein
MKGKATAGKAASGKATAGKATAGKATVGKATAGKARDSEAVCDARRAADRKRKLVSDRRDAFCRALGAIGVMYSSASIKMRVALAKGLSMRDRCVDLTDLVAKALSVDGVLPLHEGLVMTSPLCTRIMAEMNKVHKRDLRSKGSKVVDSNVPPPHTHLERTRHPIALTRDEVLGIIAPLQDAIARHLDVDVGDLLVVDSCTVTKSTQDQGAHTDHPTPHEIVTVVIAYAGQTVTTKFAKGSHLLKQFDPKTMEAEDPWLDADVKSLEPSPRAVIFDCAIKHAAKGSLDYRLAPGGLFLVVCSKNLKKANLADIVYSLHGESGKKAFVVSKMDTTRTIEIIRGK